MMNSRPDYARQQALMAFLFACGGNVAAVLNVGTLWLEPPGSSFRPMYLPLFALVIAGGTALAVFLLIVVAFRTRRCRVLAVFAALLSLAPLPLTVILTRWTMVVRDLTFSP